MIHSIRVLNYLGDYDSLSEILVIGPYETEAGRDADLARLSRLPGIYGSLAFQTSRLDPAGADYSAAPEDFAEARELRHVMDALFGFEPDDEEA